MRPTRHSPRTLLGAALALVLIVALAVALGGRLGAFGGTAGGRGASELGVICLSAARASCISRSIPYSHSWYIDNPDDMAWLGQQDARWLSQESAGNNCAGDFLTVLDFGRPSRKYSTSSSPLDDYAMSLFGHHSAWSTYRAVERLAERYLDAWAATASSCPRLHLVLGTSNYAECLDAVGTCDVSTAGRLWDTVAHDVMSYVSGKGYAGQVTGIWVGDDLEGSWDPWPTTLKFLEGARDQERTYSAHAHLVDYGDANAGACSEVTGDCAQPWTRANVYAAAWGLGWDVPLPETYSSGTARRWEDVTRAQGAMGFVGVMTECSGADPLPAGRCWVQTGSGATDGGCQWSPTVGYSHLQAAGARATIAYATNMQWPHRAPDSRSADNHGCDAPSG